MIPEALFVVVCCDRGGKQGLLGREEGGGVEEATAAAGEFVAVGVIGEGNEAVELEQVCLEFVVFGLGEAAAGDGAGPVEVVLFDGLSNVVEIGVGEGGIELAEEPMFAVC